MSQRIPAAVLAEIDQHQARVNDEITKDIAVFRDHVAHHGGDTTCATGYLMFSAMNKPHMDVCERLAVAIARIVRLENEAKTGTPAGGPL